MGPGASNGWLVEEDIPFKQSNIPKFSHNLLEGLVSTGFFLHLGGTLLVLVFFFRHDQLHPAGAFALMLIATIFFLIAHTIASINVLTGLTRLRAARIASGIGFCLSIALMTATTFQF